MAEFKVGEKVKITTPHSSFKDMEGVVLSTRAIGTLPVVVAVRSAEGNKYKACFAPEELEHVR